MSELNLNSPEFEEKISIKQAYLIMFQFLETNWEGCWETELGQILGELSLWSTHDGQPIPMDGAVLPTFLEAAAKVLTDENSPEGFRGADIKLNQNR